MTALDTGTEDLRAEIDGGVAVITMNRPDRRNAFSQAMVSALGAVLAQVETDDAVGCVVLTGRAAPSVPAATSRAWPPRRGIAGTVPARRSTPYPPPATEPAGHQRPPVEHAEADDRRYRGARPGRLSLALACDLRYAVPGAVLTTAFAKVAFAGDYGGTWFLTRLVGSAKAKSSTTSRSG